VAVLVPIVIMTIWIGLQPQVFFNLMNAATNQIVVNVTPYIQQVASVANSLP
jgi:NADH:ubiquinone oxidoreductase subunit 4 (subunit M)